MLQLQYSPLHKSNRVVNKFKNATMCKTLVYSTYAVMSLNQPISFNLVMLFNALLLIIHVYFRKGYLNFEFAVLALSPLIGVLLGYELQTIMLSLLTFTYASAIRIIHQSAAVLNKVTNLVITMAFIFCLFSYLATFLFKDRVEVRKYFGDFGSANLTMLQILSLDAWGEVGRALGDRGSSILICSFIFLMTYFYMNILVGLVLETLQEEDRSMMGEGSDQSSPFSPSCRQSSSNNMMDRFLLGGYYQIMIFVSSFVTILATAYHGFDEFDLQFEIIIALLDDLLYTLHFVLLLFKRGQLYTNERQSNLMMILHFLSGPFSFALALTYDQTLGSLFNLLKLATTPIIKGIFKGTFTILPLLLAPCIMILGGTLLVSAVFAHNYHEYMGLKGEQYFATTWSAFYTFFQVLTLDDWRAAILPAFQGKEFLPNLVFPVYIFFSNFVLLNTLIALSCEFFSETEVINQMHSSAPKKNHYLRQEFEKKYTKIPKLLIQSITVETQERDLQNDLELQTTEEQICNIKFSRKNQIIEFKVILRTSNEQY